jgi:NADH-quinone oxidoreductase subunit I
MLTNHSKIVSNRQMSFWEKIYFPAILSGMLITLKHLFKKKVTIMYPEQNRIFSEVYRGQHVLKRDELGRERCTACGLCALSCPAEAITIIAAERTKEQEHLFRKEKYALNYEINMLRCIFCGFCEEACPEQAIFLTKRIVHSEFKRKDFIYDKNKLLEPVELNKRIDISLRQITN